jgi:hypothetical protein
MVIQNDSDATTKKNTIAIYPAEDTAATFRDNKKITSLLEQQRSGAHRYVKIMTKRTPITPMLNLI